MEEVCIWFTIVMYQRFKNVKRIYTFIKKCVEKVPKTSNGSLLNTGIG
jgi:hypothetical protein